MTFSERVLSLTQNWLLPKVADNTLNSNVLTFRILGNAKEGKGESIKKPIKYQASGTATSFAGLDTFTAAALTTKVRFSYDMRGVRIPIAIPGMEAVANGVAETQVTDMVKEALEESEQELIDFLGGVVYGTGTGNSNKDPLGLGAIVDDGTNVTTLGGLSRTTYPVIKATVTASGGTLALPSLATLFTNISGGSAMSSPTLLVSEPARWDNFESLLTPTVRESYALQGGYYTVGRTGGAVRPGGAIGQEGFSGNHGFTALTYKGIPYVRDAKSTVGSIWMLNETWLDWYGWDAKGVFGYESIKLSSDTVEGLYAEQPMSDFTGFAWSSFRAPTNQFGGIADLIVLGNMLSFQPRRQGVLTGVTGV